jgi:NTE family protein
MTQTFKIPDYPRIALVLQGGGALGAYQAGVVEGLREIDIRPNWVAGISIGALNCAIIAGNPPETRVQKLREFWETICRPPSAAAHAMSSAMDMFAPGATGMMDMARSATEKMFGSMAAMRTMLEGQQGFFTPRPFAPGMGSPANTSFYETSAIISTLERLADFDRINQSGEMRVSVGATNVRTGNFVYFDNTETKLTPQHFLASGALPPGFPAVEIDGEFYWDGGCVSNTPLEYILNCRPHHDTLIFQVDLWSAAGNVPSDLFQIMERMKDIQYSSKTRGVTNAVHALQRMRQALWDTIERIPASVRKKDPWFDEMALHLYGARYNCIHLIYKNKPTEGHYKDFEFSHETMSHHWNVGLDDMRRTLENPECLDLPPPGENFVTYDVHRQP